MTRSPSALSQTSPQPEDLRPLEAALGYTFRDRQRLRQALTHRSYRPDPGQDTAATNERLEFLGDAILHFVAADEVYDKFPAAPEGRLTAMRAALVRTETLAAIAEELSLATYVRVSRGESTIDGRGRQSILADAFEAVVAAIYKDAGLTKARAVVRRLLRPRLTAIDADATINVKGKLQEAIQAAQGVTPFYRVVDQSGPVHATQFVVEVVAGDRILGRGRGIGKRQAEQRAAEEALAGLDGPGS
ncbi:MAG TPA: ribonuclease III [Chloroflexota bacterium]|jgi:ribonuclease-3|nr:ribonuclease III [Chloroflexota bacterium]